MNWTILIIGIVIVAVFSQIGHSGMKITPNSSCSDFISVTNRILSRSDIGSLGTDERADLCKVPAYQIKTGECSEYDWVAASNKMGCDTATEQGSLTMEGVKVWV